MNWGLKRHDGAGASAHRKHKELRAAWERRMFGRLRRWVWFVVYLVLVIAVLLPGTWRVIGVALAVAMGAAWIAIRQFAAPDHIQRWERGAWGEQWTAKELRPLKKEGWVVRHDRPHRNGYSNRDHILVGRGVYLLDTKNLEDELTLEGSSLRVRRIDQPRDTYVLDRLTGYMQAAARSLNREIRDATGERVWVHPVVVLWGRFEQGEAEADGVYYVHARKIREWLRNRPAELDARRREVIGAWAMRSPPPTAPPWTAAAPDA